MVPLRLDICDARPASAVSTRTHLVLKDVTAGSGAHRRAQRSSVKRVESGLFIAAATAVLLYFLVGFTLTLFHAVQQSYFPSTAPSLVMISKTVGRGDTLSKFAVHYGDSSVYLPEREEQILRLNSWLRSTPLLPGQHLRIPVTNPIVIAQIESYHHTRLASR